MANCQPTTPTPGQLLSRPQPQWQPLTAQGQLNAGFVMEMPIWQERGIAPGLVYTPPPPPPPPRLPPPPPPPVQHQQHYAAPPPVASHQSAVAGYTRAPPAAPRPVRRTRVDSSPRKAAAPAPVPAPAPAPAAPIPASGKPYGTRSRTVAHPVSTLSLPAAQNLLAETFNRDPQRVVCPLAGCEKVCASPAALQQHVLGAHVGAVHACARCNRVYKTAAGLEGHMCAGRYH